MKILTWNCNGALRNKFESILSFNSDLHIIQECENPAATKHKPYNEWAKNFFLILVILIQLSFSAKANDAFLGSRGGNVFPIFRNENIQMLKEDIRIVLDKDSNTVYCKFWFKNHSNKKIEILMGFPDYFISIASESIPLRSFSCTINGKSTDIEKRSQSIQFDGDTENIDYQKWYCWYVTFNPGETICIDNSYVGSWGAGVAGICTFDYLIGTAQTWYGKIGFGKVCFDFSKIASKNFLDTYYYSDDCPEGINRAVYNDSVVYKYADYFPEWNEVLGVSFICFWGGPMKQIIGEETEFTYFLDSASFDKQRLRLMRNEVFARHGYIFKDAELQNYFSSMWWYKPDENFDIKRLNKYEIMFVNFVKNYSKNPD